MYEYLNGIIKEKKESFVILDVNGIGYFIQIPLSSFSKLGSVGEKACIYTRFIVKEDAHFILGFHNKEEREKFDLLIPISGIGPKMALNIIGHLKDNLFYTAISEANVPLFSKIPGIGLKTSKRIILEIQDKLKNKHIYSEQTLSSQILQDGLNALIHLGYRPEQAQKAIYKVFEKNQNITLEELISTALQKI